MPAIITCRDQSLSEYRSDERYARCFRGASLVREFSPSAVADLHPAERRLR